MPGMQATAKRRQVAALQRGEAGLTTGFDRQRGGLGQPALPTTASRAGCPTSGKHPTTRERHRTAPTVRGYSRAGQAEGRRPPKKQKLQNEPKFIQAGVENCEKESQKRTHFCPRNDL